MKRIDYHDLLLRDFLVNLARAVAVFMIVTALFAMMAADLRGLPVQLGGWFLAAVLDAVLPLSLLVGGTLDFGLLASGALGLALADSDDVRHGPIEVLLGDERYDVDWYQTRIERRAELLGGEAR